MHIKMVHFLPQTWAVRWSSLRYLTSDVSNSNPFRVSRCNAWELVNGLNFLCEILINCWVIFTKLQRRLAKYFIFPHHKRFPIDYYGYFIPLIFIFVRISADPSFYLSGVRPWSVYPRVGFVKYTVNYPIASPGLASKHQQGNVHNTSLFSSDGQNETIDFIKAFHCLRIIRWLYCNVRLAFTCLPNESFGGILVPFSYFQFFGMAAFMTGQLALLVTEQRTNTKFRGLKTHSKLRPQPCEDSKK